MLISYLTSTKLEDSGIDGDWDEEKGMGLAKQSTALSGPRRSLTLNLLLRRSREENNPTMSATIE